MGQAIDYALGQWPALSTCLSDGRVEIDNNLVENAIRPTFSPVFLPPLVPGTAASGDGAVPSPRAEYGLCVHCLAGALP